MLEHDEITLFGAPPGKVEEAAFTVRTSDQVTSAVLYLRSENKRTPMKVAVYMPADEGLSMVAGLSVPILGRVQNLGANMSRRTLWALHNRLGREGYEVTIDGCGRDPMKG